MAGWSPKTSHASAMDKREHVVDGPSAVEDLERRVVESAVRRTPRTARVTDAQELHADLLHARAFAGVAAPAGDVEREAALAEAPPHGVGLGGEQVADAVEHVPCRWPGSTAASGRSGAWSMLMTLPMRARRDGARAVRRGRAPAVDAGGASRRPASTCRPRTRPTPR